MSYLLESPENILRAFALHIKCRIHIVDVFLVQFFTKKLNRFAKTLEMNDFTFAKEFDHIVDIRIIAEPQNIVIRYSGFLLWHIGIKETNIHRNTGNKRLIATYND